jgi:hypothetical protein
MLAAEVGGVEVSLANVAAATTTRVAVRTSRAASIASLGSEMWRLFGWSSGRSACAVRVELTCPERFVGPAACRTRRRCPVAFER